jgi:hypothetical protein
LVATEAGARFALLPGTLAAELGEPGRTVVTAAPEDGWDDFVRLLEECGFVPSKSPSESAPETAVDSPSEVE